ncbi:hypothetical protein Tco_1553597 [Tanacetum coccineum]
MTVGIPRSILYSTAVAVSGVPEDESRMHTHDHDGSEALDESPDSTLSKTTILEASLVKHTRPVYLAHGARKLCDTSIDHSHGHWCYSLRERPSAGLAVELSPISYLEPIVDKYNLLRGGCSDSGMSSLRSTGGGMYRDGGSGGSEGDDDGGKGGECACGAVHLARRSPAEGGDSEIGGDGDGVVMVRSLSTSASGGRDMEVWGRTVISPRR